MLTVEAVLAEYEAIHNCVPAHTGRLTPATSCVRLQNAEGRARPSVTSRVSGFHLQFRDVNEVVYQSVTLSPHAPGVGSACLEGCAVESSTGGAPRLWDWLAGVACALESVNDDLYGGRVGQNNLLVVQTARLRIIRELSTARRSRLRSMARRSHHPKDFSGRVDALTRERERVRGLTEKLMDRQAYTKELVLFMNGLEGRRVRPLVL